MNDVLVDVQNLITKLYKRIDELKKKLVIKEEVIEKLFAQCDKSAIDKHNADVIREMLSDKSLYVPDSNGDMSLLVNIRIGRYADNLEK